MATLLQLSEKIGFSVLIKLANLHEIKKYIEVAYKDKDLAYSAYFLLQFVDVNIFDIDLLEIPIFLKETEKRLQNKKNALLTSKRHVMFNCLYKKSQKLFDKVAAFKMFVQQGPYSICGICNRCLYKRPVALFKKDKYCLLDLHSFNFSKIS